MPFIVMTAAVRFKCDSWPLNIHRLRTRLQCNSRALPIWQSIITHMTVDHCKYDSWPFQNDSWPLHIWQLSTHTLTASSLPAHWLASIRFSPDWSRCCSLSLLAFSSASKAWCFWCLLWMLVGSVTGSSPISWWERKNILVCIKKNISCTWVFNVTGKWLKREEPH